MSAGDGSALKTRPAQVRPAPGPVDFFMLAFPDVAYIQLTTGRRKGKTKRVAQPIDIDLRPIAVWIAVIKGIVAQPLPGQGINAQDLARQAVEVLSTEPFLREFAAVANAHVQCAVRSKLQSICLVCRTLDGDTVRNRRTSGVLASQG